MIKLADGTQSMNESNLAVLFERAQAGDETAQNDIANYFFPQAAEQAKHVVCRGPVADEDDIALTAIKSLCFAINDGRVEYRGERELGALLKSIVGRKARKYWRLENAKKRGEGKTIGENELAGRSEDENGLSLAGVAQYECNSIFIDENAVALTPEEIELSEKIQANLQADLVGLFRELLSRLAPKPRQALLYLLDKPYTNAELAREMNHAVASVERFRAAIKRKLTAICNEDPELDSE